MIGAFGRLACRLLVGALAATAAIGGLAMLAWAVPWSWPAAALAAGVAALAWLRPLPAIAMLLAVLPFFGNRPTTPQFHWLLWVTSLVALPCLVRLATAWRGEASAVMRGGVGLAAFAYAGASWLSLSSVPFDEIADAHRLTPALDGLWQALRILPGTDVLDPYYAVLTVVLTLHACVIGQTAAVLIRREPAAVAWLAGGILTGLAACVVAGLLDFRFLIDLRSLRAFDPYTNPAGLDRLQSTFGHSGWFAQYVCFATPSVLVLRRWLQSRTAYAAAAGTLLLASLVAIVLSYQRGGWITFTLVLAYVLVSGGQIGRGEARPHTGARRPLPFVATVSVVVMMALVIAVTLWAKGEGHARASRLAERFRQIAQVTDRSEHVLTGLRLGAIYPVLGGGSETFAVRYQEEYLRAGGRYYARGYSPLMTMYGSAHNVFSQTFAGKGLVGLVALVVLLVAAFRRAWRHRHAPGGAAGPSVGARIAIGGLLAVGLYGQVQEVFYVQSLQILVFAIIGMAAGLPDAGDGDANGRGRRRWTGGGVATLLVVALGAHAVQAYGVPGRLREGYRDRQISRAGARLLPPERDRDGEYFQWTGESAFVSVPRRATRFSVELRSIAPFAQFVELRLDDRLIDRLRLDDHAWKRVEYPVGRLQELPRRLEIRVQPVWRPDGDPRVLGVMTRRISWSLPPRPDVR
jgi:O-antigen ligase